MDSCGSTPISDFLGWTSSDGRRIFFGDLRRPDEVTLKKLRVLPGAVWGDTTCSCKQRQAKRRSLQCLRCVHWKPKLGQSYMDDAAKSSWHCFFLAGVERPWMLGRRRAHLSKRTHAEICRLFPRIVLVGSVETWVTALRVPLGLESAQFSWFIMIYPVGPFLRYKSSPWKDNRRQRCFQGMKWPSLMIYSWLTLIYIYIHIILHTLCVYIYIVLYCIYNIFVEISIDIDWNKMNKAVEKNLQKAADASQSWEPVQTVWKRFQFARLPRSSSVSSISGNIQTDLNLFVRWQGVGNNDHCTNCTILVDLILSDDVNGCDDIVSLHKSRTSQFPSRAKRGSLMFLPDNSTKHKRGS